MCLTAGLAAFQIPNTLTFICMKARYTFLVEVELFHFMLKCDLYLQYLWRENIHYE